MTVESIQDVSKADPSRDHLKPLTSARFFAAAMIVLYHIPSFMPVWTEFAWVPKTFVQGVSFFFVLSGFILTQAYIHRPNVKMGSFLYARISRLWPLHLFCLLAALTYFPPGQPFDQPQFAQGWIQLANAFLVQSISPFGAYAFSGNQPSWSISTEMFFYLAFPFLLHRIRETWHFKLAGAAVLAGIVMALGSGIGMPLAGAETEPTLGTILYASPIVRGFEFCLGMACWVIWDQHVKHWRLDMLAWTAIELGVLLAIAGWLLIGHGIVTAYLPAPIAFYFGGAGSFWLFAPLIIALAEGRGIVSVALSWRPFVYLGNISFALYLTHQIVLKFFLIWLPPYIAQPVPYLVTSLFIAAACYAVIERPAQSAMRSVARFLGRAPSSDRGQALTPARQSGD